MNSRLALRTAAVATVMGLGVTAARAAVFNEVEPNDTKPVATPVAGMLPGATPVAHANFEWKGWLYVVGGVAAITGTILTAVGGARRAARGRWSVAPAPGGAHVAWSCAF